MSDLAIPEEYSSIGMEDYNPATDAVMPTLRIDHQNGVFVDALSGVQYKELDVIALGLIKQRVLWEPEVEEGDSKGPICRSYNFTEGIPDPTRFPYGKEPYAWPANFTPDAPALPCETCPLQAWGSHPTRDAPWCSEQHTYGVMQQVGGEDGGYAPALLTMQRSALKPSRTYISNFHRSKQPMFVVWTKIQLDQRKRGSVTYAVPKFSEGNPTDKALWPLFAENYRQIREFIQTPRVRDDAEEPAVASGATTDSNADARAATPTDDLPF